MKPRTAVATLISYGFSKKEVRKTLLHREPLEALEFIKGSRPKILERAEKIEEIIKNKLQEKFYPICYKDKYWPKSLKAIKDEPILLWGKGDIRKLEKQVNVAVIGTREPSQYSVEMEKRILKILLEQKCNIISGLALGCDTVAHRETVRNKGVTGAILPSGIDLPKPETNAELSEEIVKTGGFLLSEYPLGHIPEKRNYVERDRIVAALSDIVIVIECGMKSGTMHTVNYAIEYDRPIFAVAPPKKNLPGDYSGNIFLINEKKAKPIIDKETIIEKISEIKHQKNLN